MSQVKKYKDGTDNGGIQPLAPVNSKLKFKIDGKDYDADPQSLQDLFNPVFEEMKASGVAKERNRDDFFKTFQQFQKQAASGTYDIASSDGKFITAKYQGADGANLGLNEDGTTAHKTAVGNLISPFTRDDHQRMSILNTYVGDHLIRNYSKDTAALKAKTDADEAKKLNDANAGRNEFIGKFSQFQNPGTAIYGVQQGADDTWYKDKYWGQKHGQTDLLKGAFGKMGSYLFDKQFDDNDTKKLFKDKYGLSVDDARTAYSKRNFANGQFSQPVGINDLIGLSGDLQLRHNYDPYFNRQAVVKTAEPQGTAKAIAEGVSPKTPFTGINPRGEYLENDKPFTGLRKVDTGLDTDWESAESGYYWQGKKVDKDSFYKNAGKDQSLIGSVESINKKLLADKQNMFAGLTKLKFHTDKDGENTGFDKDNTGANFAFRDYIDSKRELPDAAEVSGHYSDILKHKDERLYVYKVEGKDSFGFDGLLRYRYVSPSGRKIDGVIKQAPDKTHYLTDGKVNVRLGYYNKESKANREREFETPYNKKVKDIDIMKGSVSFANGAISRNQFGGAIRKKSSSDFNSASAAQATGDFGSLSTADKLELGAIAGQLVSLGTGFAPIPGASVAAAGIGLGSTAADYTANYMKHGFKWGDVGSAAVGAGLDIATAIPGVGQLASLQKAGKLIKGSATVLKAALVGAGAVGALSSLNKIVQGGEVTIDDWRNIAGGVQAAVAGKRLTDHRFATTKNVSDVIKVNGVDQPITAAQASAIKNAKPSERLAVAKETLKDTGIDLNKLDLGETTQRSWLNKGTFGALGKKDVVEIPKVSLQNNGRKLIDYETANAWQKSAIRNTVAQKPNIAGAENYTIGKNAINTTDAGPANKGNSWNWVANSYKVKYAPNANKLPEPVSLTPKLLPPASGLSSKGTFTMDEGNNTLASTKSPNDVVNPLHSSGKSQESIKGLDDKLTVENILKNITLDRSDKSGSNTSAVNNKYHIDEIRASLGFKKGQSIKRSDINNLFKDNLGLTKQQRMIKDKFMSTSFGKGSKGEQLQLAIKEAQVNPRGRKGVKFQGGGKFDFIKGIFTNELVEDEPLKLNSFRFGPNGVIQTAPTATYTQAPKFLSMPKVPSNMAPAVRTLPLPVNKKLHLNTDVSTRNEGNKGINFSGLIPKNINPSALSELGRALYTRHLNSQIDTRVERPMMSAPVETPVAVKGNLLAASAANQQANDLIRRTGTINTTDNAVRTAAMLAANGQAGQLRLQGQLLNADMIQKTGIASQQQQAQSAAQRAQVANENVQTNARATQAERAAENDKFGRMNQPLVDYWKDRNYRADAEQQMNKQYDTAIALNSKQNEFNNAVKPLSDQLNKLQIRQSALEYKMQTGKLSPDEQIEYDNLVQQANDLNNRYSQYQNAFSTIALQTRKNPLFTTPTNTYSIGLRKDGGTVEKAKIDSKTKLAIQESKENAANAKTVAKIQQETIKNDSDNQTKKELATSKQINDLILKALS